MSNNRALKLFLDVQHETGEDMSEEIKTPELQDSTLSKEEIAARLAALKLFLDVQHETGEDMSEGIKTPELQDSTLSKEEIAARLATVPEPTRKAKPIPRRLQPGQSLVGQSLYPAQEAVAKGCGGSIGPQGQQGPTGVGDVPRYETAQDLTLLNRHLRIAEGNTPPLSPADYALQTIARLGLGVVATLLRKNQDYGSSVFKSPALMPDMDPRAAILVRMSDKIARLAHLSNKDATPQVNESFFDTIKDLAGYCILLLCQEKLK